MKKALPILLAVMLAAVSSCRPEQTNTNVNANSNNVNANSDATHNRDSIATGGIKEVWIGINFDRATSTFKIVGPVPDPICISKSNKDKIKWCFVYTCSGEGKGAATITVSGFTELGGSKRDPFSGSNSFTATLTTPGQDCANVSTDLKTDAKPGEYYKFSISATVNGTTLPAIDPGVIISE